ncbi:MAG: EAL domain-containing protein [Clostridiales bacterium]|nr:EAL domain-containing protein [Clostridiales bacterium]
MHSKLNEIEQVRFGKIVIDIDNGFSIITASNGFYDLTKYNHKDLVKGISFGDLVCLDSHSPELVHNKIIKNIQAKGESNLIHPIKTKNGEIIHVTNYSNLDYDLENSRSTITMIITDVSEHHRHDEEIRLKNEKYKMLEQNLVSMYIEYDVNKDTLQLPAEAFTVASQRYNMSRYWGVDTPRLTVHPDDYDTYKSSWDKCLKNEDSCVIEFRTKAFSYDDTYVWYRLSLASNADSDGKIASVFGRAFSIEIEKNLIVKADNDQKLINRLLTTDSLTGLYNRKTFKEIVAQRTKDFDSSKCYSITYSDINDFSYINDNFGFEAGNQVLRDFANFISHKGDNVISCRIYSDFFLTFNVVESRDFILDIIPKINDEFSSLLKEKYPASDLHVSSGVYFIPDGDVDVTIAIDNANLARRSVKGTKSIPCGIYSESMRRKRSNEQKIASELHAAIENGDIEMFLQPKFSLSNREIIGAEALARWRNSDGTHKLPFEFIDVLEKVGYVIELDYCIFKQALEQLRIWIDNGYPLIPISVNFSRLHNHNPNFVDNLISLAKEYDVPSHLIEIEITESSFAQDVNIIFKNMSKLRDDGFKINMDDFGIGYSSLSLLMKAPVDTVKVDKFFVNNISSSEDERNYIKQMCVLISTTQKNIIFEGVETEQQAKFLYSCGFNMAQGWLFDKAIPAPEFINKYLKED